MEPKHIHEPSLNIMCKYNAMANKLQYIKFVCFNNLLQIPYD
jgi:hypothetical protein